MKRVILTKAPFFTKIQFTTKDKNCKYIFYFNRYLYIVKSSSIYLSLSPCN